jgi:hypothetical protein
MANRKEQFNMRMSGYSDCTSCQPAAPITRQSNQALAAHRRVQARLEVVTDEGDRVTISFQARNRLNAAQSGEGTRAQYSSAASLSIDVVGDLSEQELGDLTRLAEALQQGKLSSPDELGSLSAFRYEYRYSESARVSTRSAWA